jgi:hypothetical protein
MPARKRPTPEDTVTARNRRDGARVGDDGSIALRDQRL